MSIVNFGEKMEKSQWWPLLKDYFHMANWILNYRAGFTTHPANCKLVLPFWEITLLLYILDVECEHLAYS